MKKNKNRLREIKKEHQSRRGVASKYERWVSTSYAISEYSPGKYRVEEWLKKISY